MRSAGIWNEDLTIKRMTSNLFSGTVSASTTISYSGINARVVVRNTSGITGTIVLTGSLDGATVTDSLSMLGGETRSELPQLFDKLSSFTVVYSVAPTIILSTVDEGGEPIRSETTILSSVRANVSQRRNYSFNDLQSPGRVSDSDLVVRLPSPEGEDVERFDFFTRSGIDYEIKSNPNPIRSIGSRGSINHYEFTSSTKKNS